MSGNTTQKKGPRGNDGASSKYKAEYAKQAEKLAKLGATDKEIADLFEVTERTLFNWKHKFPAFGKALQLGKGAADDRVERSLYNRAVGYSFDSVKIMQHLGAPVVVDFVEHVPPDVEAQKFWLKNRRRDDWRDKHDIDLGATDELAELMKVARERALSTTS